MNKRMIVLPVSALLGLIFCATTAFALPLAENKYQTIKGKVASSKLSKKTYRRVSLKVTTGSGIGERAPGDPGVPSPAVRAKVYFDNDIKLDISSRSQCDPNILIGDTEYAKSLCPNSILGGGSAAVRLPSVAEGPGSDFELGSATVDGVTYPGEVQAEVTVFRATNSSSGGKRVILFSRVGALGTSAPLIADIKTTKSKGRDYRTLLDVTIPILAANASLTRFSVTIGKKYVRARCADRNRRLNFKSDFYFSNFGEPASVPGKPWTGPAADAVPDSYLPAASKQKCYR